MSTKNNLQSANVVYSNGDNYSVRCLSYCGSVFGGGGDLEIIVLLIFGIAMKLMVLILHLIYQTK